MKISKDSWHYRFNKSLGDGAVERGLYTTCTYVRHTIANMLKLVISLLTIAVLVGTGCALVASMVALPIGLIVGWASVMKIAPLACAGYATTLIVGGAYLYHNVWVPRQQRKQSLLAQAYRDKKDGICTLVEFE